MLWPFNHFRKPRKPSRGTIEAIYGMIVTQAREPLFYRDLGVPDTVNGRFDLLVLHLWMVLRRLKSIEGGADLSQALFDRFCDDMDANLREMGVGDLTVPKRMQAFGEAFYGRAAAYDLGSGRRARSRWRRRCAGISRTVRISKMRGGLPPMPRRPIATLARTGRCDAAERIVEISVAGAKWAYSNEQNERHDGQARSLERSRHGGANPGDRTASRHRSGCQPTREAMAEARRLARNPVGARVARCDAERRRPRSMSPGSVRARVGQTCVVTLDPIENEIDEQIDLIFAPPEQIPAARRSRR